MSDLTKLKEILDNQDRRGVESGDWGISSYKEELILDGPRRNIIIPMSEIGFSFTKRGRFLGIFNFRG